MKNIELLSGDVVQEKVKAKNFPYVAFSPKENTVYYTSAPEPDQIIYTTLSGTSIVPNWFMCDLVEMSNTYNDTKTVGCVLFEAPITSINSLQDNSYLTSVIIPEGVETIEEGTFYNCNNLSKVVIPKSVKHIGSMAFCGTKLIPEVWYQENTPIYIGNWLLPSVELHSYNYNADVYTVKYGTVGIGTNTFRNAYVNKIYLPNTVKVIDDCAFYNSTINEICLSSALEVLGESAFSWCTSLTSIIIPNSITTIGNNAFSVCTSLASLVIPEGVESIGESAFSSCEKLPSITIPSSVTSIGNNAFTYCSSLTSMVVAEGNTVYDSRENCNAIIHTATNTLLYGCQNTIIPDSVTSIGTEAFSRCKSLTSIVIPNSVTNIGTEAFEDCSALTEITIPESVTEIGWYSFSSCSSLTSIVIPDGVTSIGVGAFSGCSSLTSIVIPDGVKSIEDGTFSSCTSLASITIPNSVTSIGSDAFYNCSKLSSVAIPDSVTSIGRYAFDSCSSLTSVTINSDAIVNKAYTSSSNISTIFGSQVAEYIIGDGISSIGDYAFYNCSKLSSVAIPDSVTSIGKYAFYGCSKLNPVTIPESVTSIGGYAFRGCSSLALIVIPNSVTSIGEYAFDGCSSLKRIIVVGNSDIQIPNYEGTIIYGDYLITGMVIKDNIVITVADPSISVVTIPDSVQSIGTTAFDGCSSLTSVTIPESVTSIGEFAFRGCSSLTGITIPNSITTIGEGAFYNCSSLASMAIPESATSIGDNAFYNCSGLTSIVVETGNTTYDSRENCNALIETASNTLIVGCQNTIIPNSVTIIGDNAFYNCSGLASVTIPNSITSIGENAFQNCSSLTSVTINSDAIVNKTYSSSSNISNIFGSQVTEYIIGNSVNGIGDYAFYNCSKLVSMTIPDSVTSIGSYVFSGCSSLATINVDSNNPNYSSVDGVLFNKDKTTLIQYPIGNTISEYTIPNSVTSIGEEAFKGCTSLASIVIPENVTMMGARALSNCSLDSMYFKSYTPPATSEDALTGSTIATIYVPHNSLEEYKASPLLKDHISKVVSGYVPETCISLTATASDVQYGQLTTTTIAWEAVTSGHDRCTGELIENITITGTSLSDEFELNLSETDSIERTISFTYLGTTVECTFTQGPFIPKSYTIDLNNSWELQPTNSNPNIEEYEGVYQSFSNKGINSTAAIMYLDLLGYDTFTIYVRSYGESNYDYIMVGQPNATITNSTSYNNTSLVKAHTRGRATSSTGLSAYTAVTFTGLDMGTTSRIPIVYRKDSSSHSGDDRGYLLIPKNQ